MKILPLSGAWTLTRSDDDRTYPAQVPGGVHQDLHAAGVIPDPLYRDNEKDLLWIGETEWVYRRTFEVERSFLRLRRVILRCEGLDTLATIRINGIEVGQTANMFRCYEFNIKKALRRGENTIEVAFAAPLTYIREMNAEHGSLDNDDDSDIVGLRHGGWLRKQASGFGYEHAPRVPTVGIWRDISILGVEDTRITDVHITETHDERYANVNITLVLSPRPRHPVTAVVSLARDGMTIMDNKRVTFDGDSTSIDFVIRAPALWYPHTMGRQSMYEVLIGIFDRELAQLDFTTRHFGIADFALHTDTDAFDLSCNGEQMFIKGALWVPPRVYPGMASKDEIRRLLGAAKAAGINLVRVWGGGIYESKTFYRTCNALGIVVWQDFMFTDSASYPVDDADFAANVQEEITEVIGQLAHHPSVGLWGANNAFVAGMLGQIYDDGQAVPVVPPSAQDALALMPQVHSYPHPRTLLASLDPAQGDFEQYSPVAYDRIRNFAIHDQMGQIETAWHDARDFEMTIWRSQIIHAYTMQKAVEERRQSDDDMRYGVLYGYLNDMWAAPTSASIDVSGRWKALHYAAARFYAPQLLSARVNDDQEATVFVTNDARYGLIGEVRCTLTDMTGAVLYEETVSVDVAAQSSQAIHTLALRDMIARHGADSVLLWMTCWHEEQVVAENVLWFVEAGALSLPRAQIRVQTRELGGDSYEVQLTTDVVALYVWLDSPDGTFSDNFFHLRPDHPRTVVVSAPGIGDLAVRSLVDTYM